MNAWQKALFTYVSIYVLALPLHLPEKDVIRTAIIMAIGIVYLEGGFLEVWIRVKAFFRMNKSSS